MIAPDTNPEPCSPPEASSQNVSTPSQEDTSEAFQEMSAAYELLSNPARRKEYDRKQGVTKLGFFVDVVSMVILSGNLSSKVKANETCVVCSATWASRLQRT